MPKIIAPLLVLAALAIGIIPLVAFALDRGGAIWPDAYVWRVTSFTLLQALLSTVFSIVPAIPVARALARREFLGRNLLLALFAVPQSLPVIVAVFGLTALYGTAGILGGWFSLYGLGGILLAHVFFNLPLATRLFVETLAAIPMENHRLAAQLGLSDSATFRTVDWPALKPALPRIAALIFLLCAGSFVVVLLFGGPASTTLEVAIYQSLRMDFDVSRALTLSLVQILLSVALVIASASLLTQPAVDTSLRTQAKRWDGKTPFTKIIDAASIVLATALVAPVLMAILVQGLGHITVDATMIRAITTSLVIAMLSTLIALPLAWGMVGVQHNTGRLRSAFVALGLAGYILPPAVIATGWFLAFRSINGFAMALALITCLNAVMALPFLLSLIAPAREQTAARHDRLCSQLDIRGWNRLRHVDIPTLRGPLAQAALMAFVLSMGDLTAVTLLGTQGLITLPSLVQQQMGHYQSAAAGGTALILAAICLTLSLIAQRVPKWT